jgi:hypothetical protein
MLTKIVQNIGNELLTAYANEDYETVLAKWEEARTMGDTSVLELHKTPNIVQAVIGATKWMSENDPVWVAMSELSTLKSQVLRSCGYEEIFCEETGLSTYTHKETGEELKPGGRYSLTRNGYEFGPFTI